MMSSTRRESSGSRSADGSSKKRMSGSREVALARAARMRSPAHLRGVVLLVPAQAHDRELERCDLVGLAVGEGRVEPQLDRDVLEERHPGDEHCTLEEDAEASLEPLTVGVGAAPEALAVVEDVAGRGTVQTGHVPEQQAPARAAVADDREDPARGDLEVEAALHDLAPGGHREPAHLDPGRRVPH
jgi:hypothetical protein